MIAPKMLNQNQIKTGARLKCINKNHNRNGFIGTVSSATGDRFYMQWDDNYSDINGGYWPMYNASQYFELYIPDDCS